MKRIFLAILSILLLVASLLLYIVFFVNGGNGIAAETTGDMLETEQPEEEKEPIPQTVNDISYTEILPPEWPAYEAATTPTIPWDMILFDGELYVGSGDYDKNAGPVFVMKYNSETGVWENTGELPDEQINRFCIIDGKLTIPGTDPQEDWTLGNYYVLQDGIWTVVRNIPYAIHNFDMVEYNGEIFAGLGVSSGYYPVAVSSDGGVTFEMVEMYKNGEKLDTSDKSYIRVYDLVVFDDVLYAFYRVNGDDETRYFELYRFNTETRVFEYMDDLSDDIKQIKISYDLVRAKVNFNNRLYFSTGLLYQTDDMQNFEKVELKENHIVCDVYEENGELYVLSGCSDEDGKYTVSVWQLYDETFVERFNFKYDTPPISFACADGTFYIGFGNYVSENVKNGTFVSVKID